MGNQYEHLALNILINSITNYSDLKMIEIMHKWNIIATRRREEGEEEVTSTAHSPCLSQRVSLEASGQHAY